MQAAHPIRVAEGQECFGGVKAAPILDRATGVGGSDLPLTFDCVRDELLAQTDALARWAQQASCYGVERS